MADSRLDAPLRHRRARAWVGIAIAMVLLALISRGHFAASGDALHYMVIAQSMVLDGDVDLANDYADASRIVSGDPGDHAQRGRGGALRPVHDVGLPGLAAPPFAIAYWLAERTDALPGWLRERATLNRFIALRQLISVMMIALTVWLGAVLFDIATQLSARTGFAAVSAWVVSVSPPLLAHGYVFLTEIPTALVCAIVMRDVVARRSAGPGRAILLGVATGFLVLMHARNVGLVLGLAGMYAWHVRARHTGLIVYLAGVATAIAVRSALNLHFWGTLVVSPHARVGEDLDWQAAAAEMVARALGLLFDARHGLLPWAPIFLLVPAGLILLWRREPVLSRWLIVVAAAYLAFVLMPMTNAHGWRGGWSPAARFLVPVIPLAAVAGAAVGAAKMGRRVAAGLVTLQVLIDLLLWTKPMLLWSEGPGPSPLLLTIVGDVANRLPPIDGVHPAAIGLAVAWSSLAALLTWIIVRGEPTSSDLS